MTRTSKRDIVSSAEKGRRSDTAFDQIMRMIYEGTFAAGDRLPAERELANSLKVSRPTLRDAINRLEARGMIRRKIGSGNYVCTTIPDSVRSPLEDGVREKLVTLQQIIDVRKPLEIWAAECAAQNPAKKDLAALSDALKTMRKTGQASNSSSNQRYTEADIDFHLTIARMTRNPVYLHLIQFLTELIFKSLTISRQLLDDSFTQENTKRHQAIYDSIAARNSTAAGKAMAKHFEFVENNIR